MPRGKTAAQMVNIRSRRGPFSDPRDGRLLRGIRYCAIGKDVEVLTTSQLLEWTYAGHRILGGKNKSWHREMIRRACRKVATPIGRSPKGRGRPMMWRVDPARIRLRSLMERLKRKRARQGAKGRIDNTE